MDKLDHIELLIVNYLKGTISASESQELREWINRSEENQLQFDRMREIWLAAGLSSEKFRFDSQAAFERFKNESSLQSVVPQPRIGRKIILSYPWAAAILVFMILGGAAMWFYMHSSGKGHPSTAYQEITVPNGSRSKIRLPDSSFITINAGTTLRYNTDFGIDQRNIWLDGEAYFVVHKSSTPFVVHSGTVQIKAVGTEFNVRAYSSENQIETTLVTGKVIVSDASEKSDVAEEVALFPNQKLIVSKGKEAMMLKGTEKVAQKLSKAEEKSKTSIAVHNKMVKQERVDPAPNVSWKDEEWVIYRESLGDLSVKLERRYNVKIVFVDENLKSLRYNGTLPDQSLEQVLKLMSMVSPIRYTVQGKTVVFSENKHFKTP